MEELQDAIEDAQYVNAINTQEDGPRPVLPWEKPSPEILAEWVEKKSRMSPGYFELDALLESPIAFFLFSLYVKQKKDDYTRINFCEDVLRFKKLRGRSRRKQAQYIVDNYLDAMKTSETSPTPTTSVATGESTSSTPDAGDGKMTLKQPPRTEIDECDLERRVPKMDFLNDQKMVQLNFDYPTCSETVVGIKGPIRTQIWDQWKLWEAAEKFRKSESMPPSHHVNQEEAAAEAKKLYDSETGFSELEDETREGGESEILDQSELADQAKSEFGPGALKEEKSDIPRPDTVKDRSISLSSDFAGSSMTASMRVLTTKFKSGKKALYDNLFDKAEALIMNSLREDYWASFCESEEYEKVKNFLWYQDRSVVPDDFYVMRVLGRGGFGLVNACKKGTSGKLYAMKVMDKKRIKMKKSEQLAVNERKALAAVESNFVVNLKYSFHSKDDVYLVLDLMTGGDLGFHLHQKGRFPKREVQYYAARIMLGLQALHDKSYVYRDLKPENCLLADDGRVKITDLGLATKITPTLHGAAGTRGYWAPEMLRRDKKGKRMPYGHTVDWFSFGCCVTEFICGANPFRSEAALNFGLAKGKQTKEKAIDCATLEMEPEFPSDYFESDAADMCKRLLDKNEKNRLGTNGCEEIMAHPYFKNMNWEAIISDRKRPPFVPAKDVNAASQSEIGNFTEDKTYQETTLTAEDEEFYKHWTWTNPYAYATEVIEFLIYERETGEPLLPIAQNVGCCCNIL